MAMIAVSQATSNAEPSMGIGRRRAVSSG